MEFAEAKPVQQSDHGRKHGVKEGGIGGSKLPSSKFPCHAPKTDLEFAEQALFEEMEHAAELLQSEEDFGRSGVCHAIHSCHSFLHVRGLSG
jgi:hypothetical protein